MTRILEFSGTPKHSSFEFEREASLAHELDSGEFFPGRQGEETQEPIGAQAEVAAPDRSEELEALATDETAVVVEAGEAGEVHRPTTQRQRAAMRSGQHIGRYVRRPRGDHSENGSRVKSYKDKRRRLQELQDEDNRRPKGLGLQWWLNQIKQARATHAEACSCLYCSSPY